jgi:hypothetical protein
MLRVVDFQTRRVRIMACKSAIELFELDKSGTLRYLLRGGEQRLDLVLSEAVAKSVSAIGFVICRTLAARPSSPSRRSIGWQEGKTFVPGGRPRSSQPTHRRQHPPQRLLVDAAIDAHSNPIRAPPDRCRPAYRASCHWYRRALACVGNDTKLNEFPPTGRLCSRCQIGGLPGRSPIVQRALRDPVPLGNDRSVTALGLHFGHQRRLLLRRPLPAALNHDLAIHSKHSFWTVQKGPASLSTLLSTTVERPV